MPYCRETLELQLIAVHQSLENTISTIIYQSFNTSTKDGSIYEGNDQKEKHKLGYLHKHTTKTRKLSENKTFFQMKHLYSHKVNNEEEKEKGDTMSVLYFIYQAH